MVTFRGIKKHLCKQGLKNFTFFSQVKFLGVNFFTVRKSNNFFLKTKFSQFKIILYQYF